MRTLFVLLVVALLSSACSSYNTAPKRRAVEDADLVSASYTAADALLTQAPWLKERSQPLLTATFVNINSLENSSPLGRIVSEQISSRFAQQGFTVVEMKLRTNVYIRENAGEFALSRSVKNLSRVHNAGAVIAGTYAVGRNSVFVSSRLVRAADNRIIAAYDYTLPIGPDTKALLATQ